MPDPRRAERSSEAQALGDVLSRLTSDRILASGMALGRLAARWADVVGDRLAAETAPVRLERGTLMVRASNASWAAQIRFLEVEIASRATTPSAPVRAVRVVVDGPGAPPSTGAGS